MTVSLNTMMGVDGLEDQEQLREIRNCLLKCISECSERGLVYAVRWYAECKRSFN